MKNGRKLSETGRDPHLSRSFTDCRRDCLHSRELPNRRKKGKSDPEWDEVKCLQACVYSPECSDWLPKLHGQVNSLGARLQVQISLRWSNFCLDISIWIYSYKKGYEAVIQVSGVAWLSGLGTTSHHFCSALPPRSTQGLEITAWGQTDN